VKSHLQMSTVTPGSPDMQDRSPDIHERRKI